MSRGRNISTRKEAKNARHHWSVYYVVEPLEDEDEEGGHQIWRVCLSPLTKSDAPDGEDIVTSVKGGTYWWRWEKVGPIIQGYDAARSQGFVMWYG